MFIDGEIDKMKITIENMYYQVLTCKFQVTGPLVGMRDDYKPSKWSLK
jgi:hypothetical protein